MEKSLVIIEYFGLVIYVVLSGDTDKNILDHVAFRLDIYKKSLAKKVGQSSKR